MDGMISGAEIKPLAGALGAEVTGLDLTALDDQGFTAVHQAFLDYQVLVFRDQTLSPAAYKAVAAKFGDPVPYPFAKGIEGHPEITIIAKEPHQTSNFGGMWHSDTTYKPDPPKATMLYCVETPQVGGDTIFACQYRAHAALSEGMQTLLGGLKGVSSSAKNASQLRGAHLATGSMKGTGKDDTMTALHPVIRTHPETGRKALYVNRSHTTHFDGWTATESVGMLDFLFTHQIQPEFTARVRWAPGTLVIWDNRSSQHCAINDYDGHRREMWRITLAGDRPD
ncbi:MAG: TauD/TfdA family dioxygenase [Pseudomonadota bacterium]